MDEKLKNYLSVTFWALALVIISLVITVITREVELSFDPVLPYWCALLLIFALIQYKSVISALLLSIPLLKFSVLPAVGFSDIQNNPNNQNLLNSDYYYMAGVCIVVALGFIKLILKLNE